MSTICPICDSNEAAMLQSDVKSGVPIHMQKDKENIVKNCRVKIKLMRCNDCHLDYLETWDCPEDVYNFYNNNNYICEPNITKGPLKYDERKKRVERVLPYVNQKTRLLDIGCGNGAFLKDLKKHVKTIEGMELTKQHVEDLTRDGIKVWDCFLEEFEPEVPYDVVVMHATLEHIADINHFMVDLKRVIHDKSKVFVEVPNMRDPLANIFDIEAYRKFFYREYHLYYFSEISLFKLFEKFDFKQAEIWPEMVASLSNHFHWINFKKGQPDTNTMVNMVLDCGFLDSKLPNGNDFTFIMDEIDDTYRKKLQEAGVGDLLIGCFSLT
jgi:ubiquinone/menaquinone biosynthesis C-methylase UbiE